MHRRVISGERPGRLAGARYGALVRELELYLATSQEPPDPDVIKDMKGRLDKLAEDAPELPEAVWRRSQREVPVTECLPVPRTPSIREETGELETARLTDGPGAARAQSRRSSNS